MMEWVKTDGGRSKYYKARDVGDCGTRALAITENADYKETYMKIKNIIGYYPRNGICYIDYDILMEELGYVLHECGDNESTTRLNSEELKKGIIICRIKRHYVALIDGVIHDSWNCSRTKKGEIPIVHRYWTKPE